MKGERLETYIIQLMHVMAEMNQEIFSSCDYSDFLSLCNNDISILALLEEHPGETARQISVRLKLPKTTVVTAVSRLVKRGFVIREKNAQDGREQLLHLSELGRNVNLQHWKYEKEFLNHFLGLFREEDHEALADILERSRVCSIIESKDENR